MLRTGDFCVMQNYMKKILYTFLFAGLLAGQLAVFETVAYSADYSYRANSSEQSEDYRKKALEYAGLKSAPNLEKALEYAKKALDMFPDNHGYNYLSAYCLDQLGRHEEATPYWEKYFQIVKMDIEKRREENERYTHKSYIEWAEKRLQAGKEKNKK